MQNKQRLMNCLRINYLFSCKNNFYTSQISQIDGKWLGFSAEPSLADRFLSVFETYPV